MRWFALLCVAAVAATPCSKERLKSLLVEQRHRSWVCENVRLKVIEDYPWEVWALDTAEAFEQLNFKVLVPHPVEDSEDLLWSLVERPYNQTLPDGSRRGPPVATARFWTNMHAPPGRAFAVEGMNRLSPVQEWLPKLYATLGIAGSVDLYCARVGRRPVNSYGWHTDTVDALIYVLNGTKRVRVAGHFPGSRVTLDKVISAGSVVYVPGGRFHSLRSMPADVDASKAELVVALSIGLPNPNEDLLEVRTNVMRKAFENQNFKWNDVVGQVAALPEDFPRKPEVVFAEKDDLDSHGFSALHRRTLQGDARRLAVLLHSGAEVNLRSLPSAQRPALTALGLAACCVAEEPALLLTAKLLEFSADPKAVEFHEDGRSYSALEVAARRSEAFAQKLRSRLEVAEEL